MAAVKKIKLRWIKGLMIFSQVVLLAFTVQWLVSQYNEQRSQLKQNLTKLFIGVQQRITDSLLLTNVYDTAHINKAIAANTTIQAASDSNRKIKLSAEGLHRVLTGAANISASQERKLFSMDTSIFNDIFTKEMRQNGWAFHSKWISASDSDKLGEKAIFIRSNFFTNANGVVINNYWWFLFCRLLPQIMFVTILLALTGAASWIMFRSLGAQIKLSQLKDDFISNMSHELKTPIATVKVALEALNNFNAIENPTLGREYLGMAASEMDRLELLATRVLNTSLLESGRIYLQQETYDLKKLVEEVLQNMQPRFQKQNAQVSFSAAGSGFLIAVDKLHMQGVLVNLLDNSLKYGQGKINIDVRLTETNGSVQLALADNGPGIPEEYREKVFEKFFRVPSGNRHNIKGHGLGLNYAAQVMRLHKGSINVNNIAGGGCMFTLTF